MVLWIVSVLLIKYQEIKILSGDVFHHMDLRTESYLTVQHFNIMKHFHILYHLTIMITSWDGKSRNNPTVYRWRNWTKTSYPRWNNYEVTAESILSLSPLPNYVTFSLPHSFWFWGFGYLIAFNCNLVEKTYLIFFSAYILRNNFLRNDLVFLVISLNSISETQKLNQTLNLIWKPPQNTISPRYCSYQAVTLIIIWIWDIF